jgi:hypothetical protein
LIITHDRPPLGDPVLVAAPLRVSLDAVTADATLDKIDKLFMPGLLEVQMGIRVYFPNHDHVRHQVYSFSLAKPFGLPLNAGFFALIRSRSRAQVQLLSHPPCSFPVTPTAWCAWGDLVPIAAPAIRQSC